MDEELKHALIAMLAVLAGTIATGLVAHFCEGV